MSISASAILAFVISKHDADTPGISDKVRDRLEWTWGLRHNHLDEHLQEFNDPQMHNILMDNSLLVMPHSEYIHEISGRNLANLTLKFDVRRPHIKRLYKGCTSFEYVVVPIAPDSPLPPRMLVSEVPPHLVICITAGKILKTWGHLAGEEYAAVRLSFIERLNAAAQSDWPPFRLWHLNAIHNIRRGWSFMERVPPSFVSEDFDQTMIDVPESLASEYASSDSGIAWEVGSSASCYHEPKRRLLPSELLQKPLFLSAEDDSDDDDDDDDTASSESDMSGVEESEESTTKGLTEGDDDSDHAWVKGIVAWAEDTAGADDGEMLLNDIQIKEDLKEQPRVAASLDLDRPDYLTRRESRRRT